MRTFTTSE